MKSIVLIGALILLSACAVVNPKPEFGVEERTISPTWYEKMQGYTKESTVFSTAYGDIVKGASMSDVMQLLGNPQDIVTSGGTETWRYYFGPYDNLSVSFINKKVETVLSQDPPVSIDEIIEETIIESDLIEE